MGLKKDDRLTIRRAASVQLTQYDTLKPQVILSRVMGADPEADVAEMERVCYVELRKAVIEELLTRRRFDKILGSDVNVTALLKHCEKVISRGYDKARAGNSLPPGAATSEESTSVERAGKRIRTFVESTRKKAKRERP